MTPYLLATHILICTQDNITPLYLASQGNYSDVVELLLAAGAQVDLQRSVGAKYCVQFAEVISTIAFFFHTLSVRDTQVMAVFFTYHEVLF